MTNTLKLTSANIILYAMKNYDNPHCIDVEEFYADFNRIKYIKRLLNRRRTDGAIKERLILNHLILFYNVFFTEAATKILFAKIDKESWPILKTFLIYLSLMPEKIEGISEEPILSSSISVDLGVAKLLRELKA